METTYPDAWMIVTRHPEYETEYEIVGGSVEVIELDLGGSFDITRYPTEDALVESAREHVQWMRQQVKDAPAAVREAVERALSSFDTEDWRVVLDDTQEA